MRSREFLKISGRKPKNFHGSVNPPPSKSYFHRALFISSLCSGESKLLIGKHILSEDIEATIRVLTGLGIKILHGKEDVRVEPRNISFTRGPLYVGGSGTSARFAISFSALARKGKSTTITGDESLSRRPMLYLVEALSQLGVKCDSNNGKLPLVVEGGGIEGGECTIEGSVSSQFISSLLIACTRARNDCVIRVSNQSEMVSKPYIESTLAVLKHFGFVIESNSSYSVFKVKGNQIGQGRTFKVPPDMSSVASLVAAALASKGKLRVTRVSRLPQPDSAFLKIAKRFGAKILYTRDSLTVESSIIFRKDLQFDLADSPDLVPIVSGVAAALGLKIKITNVGHLRFKESDRLTVIAREFWKLGLATKQTTDSIIIFGGRTVTTAVRRKPIFLDPENDHRILMALSVAALSGRFGQVMIADPACVDKSYPEFVSDIQTLSHEPGLLKICHGEAE